jgi:CubicO group peptidase (beta-lactamase class C family)
LIPLLGSLLAVALLAPAQSIATELNPTMQARVAELVPKLEAYIAAGMKAFDDPGLAIGIVVGDDLVYAKGFGVRKKGGDPVNTRTVFQIGSTSKGFLATTMAIAVDRGLFRWDDRLVDLDSDWQLKDPWVTQEFRMFDILAQRSGLPADVNDSLSFLGFDKAALIHSLRYVEPVSSFRSTFAYTNVTHLEAGRIVAKVEGAPDWEAVVRKDIFMPLGMMESSATADAIEAAPNHAIGHRWAPDGAVEVPFSSLFPYAYAGAGAINSTVDDMARWLRMQLGDGNFEGRQVVSAENLGVTRLARVAVSDRLAYAMGWMNFATPNGTIVWHNGGTPAFGAFVGLQLDRKIGVVVLTNETNVTLPDSIGFWVFDRLLGNPEVDHVANGLKNAKAGAERSAGLWAKPGSPRQAPAIQPLTGAFANPSVGEVSVKEDGDALRMEFSTGAVLKLTPWDGEVFTAALVPIGLFAAIAANLGPMPLYFAQFQMDGTGKLNVLRLIAEDGQSYEFQRCADIAGASCAPHGRR